jgi:hypothetical protein
MRRAKSFGLWAFATALCLGVSSAFAFVTTVAVRSGFGPAVIVMLAATVLFSIR